MICAALVLLGGGRGRLGAMLTYPPQAPWLAPSLVLGLVGLALGNRRALACNAVAALVVLFVFMGFTWSLRIGRPPPGQTLRVMTYNIEGGSGGTFRVLNDVLAQQPDIVAFQEAAPWNDSLDAVEDILTALPGFHLERSRGLAVISRFSIISSRVASLPPRRPCLQVRVAAPHRPLTVITTHLSSVELYRNPGSLLASFAAIAEVHDLQARALSALAAQAEPPVIVLGDLNSPPGARPCRRLRRFGADAFAAAGRGFGYTYSAHRPLLRIDYIFAGPGLRVSRVWTPRTHGSDHRPVVAEIVIPAAPP